MKFLSFWSGMQQIMCSSQRKASGTQHVSDSKPTYFVGKELVNSLDALAKRAGCSPNQVASELIAQALSCRKIAEINFQRWGSLSPREQQIVALVCLNLTNQEIANQLGISQETVKSHLQNIFAKFDTHNRSDLRLLLADWDFSNWA